MAPKAAGPKPPVDGVNWPKESEGSTTKAAKKVWAVAARAGKDENLATAIEQEKDWRFQYHKHAFNIAKLAAKKDGKTLASEALKEVYDTFWLKRKDGSEMSLTAAVTAPVKGGYFSTKTVKGEAKDTVAIEIPYKGKTLTPGDNLEGQLDAWADYGTMEPDAAVQVKEACGALKSGSLKGHFFALLGAGSEMGPFKFLLEQGATVLAVRTKKAAEWEKMEAFAKTTCGTLLIPQKDGVSGCDIMGEPLEIRDWIIENSKGCSSLTVGLYTYLDSEAHVRVTLGCDLIQASIEKLATDKRVILAYIGTPSIALAIPTEAANAMETNRGKTSFWFTMSCPSYEVADVDGVKVANLHSVMQGPNYSLAKTIQVWRNMVSTVQVSTHCGPFTKTESVTHNATFKVLLEALAYIPPMEAYDPITVSKILSLMLVYDVLKGKKAELEKPAMITAGGAWHGGCWRTGLDTEKSRWTGGLLLMLGRIRPI